MFHDNPEADDSPRLSRTVLRLSSAVPKHPNLRMCDLCGHTYCIRPDDHETRITIARHIERRHSDEM